MLNFVLRLLNRALAVVGQQLCHLLASVQTCIEVVPVGWKFVARKERKSIACQLCKIIKIATYDYTSEVENYIFNHLVVVLSYVVCYSITMVRLVGEVGVIVTFITSSGNSSATLSGHSTKQRPSE